MFFLKFAEAPRNEPSGKVTSKDEKADHKAEIEAMRIDHAQKINFLKEQVKFKEEQMLAKDKLLEAITHMVDSGKK